MRNIDHLVLASCERILKWTVMFVDGVEVKIWASNEGQAKILATKLRQAERMGVYYASCAVMG